MTSFTQSDADQFQALALKFFQAHAEIEDRFIVLTLAPRFNGACPIPDGVLLGGTGKFTTSTNAWEFLGSMLRSKKELLQEELNSLEERARRIKANLGIAEGGAQ